MLQFEQRIKERKYPSGQAKRLSLLPTPCFIMRLPTHAMCTTPGSSRIRLGTRWVLPFLPLPFSLGERDLSSHLHCMGTTGAGKSKLLAHLATQLILSGRSCAVIDPHADLAH